MWFQTMWYASAYSAHFCICPELHSIVRSLLDSLLMTAGHDSALIALTSGDGRPRWGAS